jgi:hypothetical protein
VSLEDSTRFPRFGASHRRALIERRRSAVPLPAV